VIVNRTSLSRSPTQNQALEAVALIDKISSVTFRRKVNERLDFRSVGPETGMNFRRSGSFISPARCLSSSIVAIRFISSKVRSTTKLNQGGTDEDRYLEYRERQTVVPPGAMPFA
jgi:hypothetical protein